MPNSFLNHRLLTPEYFYEYSEPHRRRPTIFEFPAFTIHTATYFSTEGPAAFEAKTGEDERRFRQFLERFKGWHRWSRAPHEASFEASTSQIDDLFIKNFARHVRPSESGERSAPGAADEVMSFECSREQHSPLAVRVEVHREYFSLTIFCRLTVEADSHMVRITCPPLSASMEQFTAVLPCHSATRRGVLDVVFEEVRARVIEFVDAEPLRLYGAIATHFPECTFANFHGCTLPAEALCPPIPGAPNPPKFASRTRSRMPDDVEHNDTQAFLSSIWPQLRRNLFAPGTDDVIACYMQRGHSIYISSLGSQTGPRALDDLRYVVFYCGEESGTDRHGKAWETQARQQNWRISRLIYRLHEAGTLRLAALRKLRRLRQAMQSLTGIEGLVAIGSWPRYLGLELQSKTRRATKMLYGVSRGLGEPVQYRLSRSRFYFRRARSHLDELGIMKIPGWQSYEEFLKRRAFQTYEQIEGLNVRIDRVLRYIQTQNSALQNSRSLFWQLLAVVTAVGVAIIGLPPSMGDTFQRFAGSSFLFWQVPLDERTAWRQGYGVGWLMFAVGAVGLLILVGVTSLILRINERREEAIRRQPDFDAEDHL